MRTSSTCRIATFLTFLGGRNRAAYPPFRKFLEARIRDEALLLAPSIKWIAHPHQGHSEVWFCGWDRRKLLARIAGSFSCVQLNILSADIFTRGDSLVLDIFRVCSTGFEAVTDEKEITQVEKRLRQSLETEDHDFTPHLEKVMKKRGFHLSQRSTSPHGSVSITMRTLPIH
jgi:[protein-PII] uridylyltransferase